MRVSTFYSIALLADRRLLQDPVTRVFFISIRSLTMYRLLTVLICSDNQCFCRICSMFLVVFSLIKMTSLKALRKI